MLTLATPSSKRVSTSFDGTEQQTTSCMELHSYIDSYEPLMLGFNINTHTMTDYDASIYSASIRTCLYFSCILCVNEYNFDATIRIDVHMNYMQYHEDEGHPKETLQRMNDLRKEQPTIICVHVATSAAVTSSAQCLGKLQ